MYGGMKINVSAQFLILHLGAANGTLGLEIFLSDLEVSTAVVKSLVHNAFISVLKSPMFGLSLGFSYKGLGVSTSLGFYDTCELLL